MNNEFLEAVEMLEKNLRRRRDEGETRVRVKPENVAALGRRGAKPAPTAPQFSPQRSVVSEKPKVAEAPLTPVLEGPRKSKDEVVAGLSAIAREIGACTTCRLCKTRKNVVPGQGHPAPEIMFIGEGPGADEDEQGLAFVGRAGQLLTKIIEAMGFTRDEVFIGNIVKCRPPDNRVPLPDEMAACIPFLHRQIELLRPKVIVALGATAMKGLFGEGVGGITKIRGTWMLYRGIEVMPTYHPAYLLRNPPAKPDVWEDMKTVLAKLGRPVPQRKKDG